MKCLVILLGLLLAAPVFAQYSSQLELDTGEWVGLVDLADWNIDYGGDFSSRFDIEKWTRDNVTLVSGTVRLLADATPLGGYMYTNVVDSANWYQFIFTGTNGGSGDTLYIDWSGVTAPGTHASKALRDTQFVSTGINTTDTLYFWATCDSLTLYSGMTSDDFNLDNIKISRMEWDGWYIKALADSTTMDLYMDDGTIINDYLMKFETPENYFPARGIDGAQCVKDSAQAVHNSVPQAVDR